MLARRGFSILEIMVAVAVLSSLGLGIYRLQLAGLSSGQQSLIRQLATKSASNLANQIYANLVYASNTTIARSPSTFAENSSTAYTLHLTTPSPNCSTNSNACTQSENINALISTWKMNLSGLLDLPSANIFAAVCLDGAMGVPTVSTPNCSGSGALVIKIAWVAHNNMGESAILGENNYVMLKVPQR